MRELVAEINDAYYKGDWRRLRVLRAELTVRLNPTDPEDERILEALPTTIDSVNTANEASEFPLKQFNERMALMLKHDWERAKIEAGEKKAFPAALIALSWILILASFGYTFFQWFFQRYSNWSWRLFAVGAFLLVAGYGTRFGDWKVGELVKERVKGSERNQAKMWAALTGKAYRHTYGELEELRRRWKEDAARGGGLGASTEKKDIGSPRANQG